MDQKIKTKPADNQEMEIDLVDLLGYYMSKLPLLIAAIVIGALVSGLVTYFAITDKYTATSKMYMVSASSDSVVNLQDLNLGTSLSQDYLELMKSRPAIEDVITKLKLDLDYRQVSDMINLTVVNNTRIIQIGVTSTDPQLAMDIANQMTHTTKILLPKVMETPSPSIVEEATLPTVPSEPSLKKNVMIGALLLLILVLAVLTVLYLLDDTIKSAEDLEAAFGVMPLSVVPEGEISGLKKEDSKADRKLFRKRAKKKYKEGGKS